MGKDGRLKRLLIRSNILLDLSYLWTGSINGLQLQVGATWLFYSILIDLGDGVADELSLPLDSISLEMLYRGFYHFIVAYDQGKATDIIQYFAAPQNQDLGVVKSPRKPKRKLIIAPFPERQKNDPHFFFENPLTSCFAS